MSGSSYLIVGKERLLKQEFIRDLQKKLFPGPSEASMNTQEWDLSESGSLDGLLDFVRTAPFLVEKRMAILRPVEDLEDADRKKLLASLAALPSSAVFLLVSEEAGTKKSAFLRDLETHCTLVACHTPFEKDLPGWVEQRVRKSGGTIDREASRNLVEKTGKDTGSLQNAVDELLLFTHPRTSITAQDINQLLGKTSEEDVFAIAEDLFQKNSRAALEKTESLFREGVRAPEVIGVLAGQLERMKHASDLLERGASAPEVASALRVPSFVQQKFFIQLKKTSKAGIVRMQKRLLECDLSIKEGRSADRLALERFILEN